MSPLFYELLQIALGTRKELSQQYTPSNWQEAYRLAERQGVAGVCFGAIESLNGQGVPFSLKMQWIGLAESYRRMYKWHMGAIGKLASFYAKHSMPMLLMKGYGLSFDYPVPEYRPVGDIDIYFVGAQEKADRLVEDELAISVEAEYHKHSHFTFEGVSIENHYKFLDDEKHKSNVRFERILEDCLEGTKLQESPIKNCYLPSATWNALFLLRHAGEHFASNEIKLRHVLDLGTFYRAHHLEIDWKYVLKVYEEEGMMPFYDAIATICVRNLGMEAECFRGYHHNELLADRTLSDIFAIKEELPQNNAGIHRMGIMRYGIKKSIRWWHNRWKYKMVYKENLWESFWTLVKIRITG